MGKIRVYESTQNPVAREMIGYLIVRGGVHQEAYAKAPSDLSGVDVTKLLPVPEISSLQFPDAKKYMDKGFHRISCTASAPTTTSRSGRSGTASRPSTAQSARWRTARPRAARSPTLNRPLRSTPRP